MLSKQKIKIESDFDFSCEFHQRLRREYEILWANVDKKYIRSDNYKGIHDDILEQLNKEFPGHKLTFDRL